MLKKKLNLMIILVLGLSVGCTKVSSITKAEPKPGHYYMFDASGNGYKVLKVLDVSEGLTHVCYYNNIFKNRPTKEVIPTLYFGNPLPNAPGNYIDGDQSQTRMGKKHVALTKENWKHWSPEFLAEGVVQSNELLDYEAWQSGDRKIESYLWTPNQ